MDTKIFLQKFYGKNRTNKSTGLNVNLSGNRKLLPPSSIEEHVNLYEQYVKEREESNIIRLMVQVNPICTNVLCNNITEIVRNEGSKDVEVLNYGKVKNANGSISGINGKGVANIIGKSNEVDFWNGGPSKAKDKEKDNIPKTYQAIRDTQLSKKDIGFIYHCGKDIFNNHLLRSHTFKCICKPSEKEKENAEFNTIEDTMRNGNGEQVKDYRFFPISAPNDYKVKEGSIDHLHVYEYDDIDSYRDTLENRMIIKYNGWLGFINRPKLETFDTDKNGNNKPLDISRPILYKNAGDFIDMYPERDLFLFNPLYNSSKNRIEKNWNYCITYPSSSKTEGIDFINTNNGLNSLKVVGVDEYTKNDNGAGQFVIYSASMHGLMEGDTVNVYKTYDIMDESGKTETINQLVCSNSSVISVVDEYTFVIYNNTESISQKWVDANNAKALSGAGFTMDASRNFASKDNKKYYVINGRINVDDTAQNISYKKVIGGVEVDYYVRIFSKLPNFKFSDTKPTENELYKSGSTLVDDYQSVKEEFESHVSKLAFARNIYGDKESEIVFTDNIDLTGLKDNRGKPISTLYLTIIKNNKGYKKWYGKKGKPIDIKDDSIEYSHCFGKVNCGFYQSQEAYQTDGDYITIQRLQNVGGISGLSQANINNTAKNDRIANQDEDDEIDYYTDKHFYGDLVCYDSLNCNETHIQYVNFRFNTAQRELTKEDTSFEYFKKYYYDEIKSDDYDKDEFHLEGENGKWPSMGSDEAPVCQRKEGYYYQPHFEIPIHTFGKINSAYPDFLSIRSFSSTTIDDTSSKDIYVLQTHFLEKGDKVMLYDMTKETYYTGVVIDSTSPKKFICDFYDKDGNNVNKEISITTENKTNFKLFKIDNLEIPNYAELMRDGSCRLVWRDIIHNGTASDKTIETYPFTNGALYINKPINLVVKRQDPFDLYDLIDNSEPFDKLGVSIDENKIDASYSSSEIQC